MARFSVEIDDEIGKKFKKKIIDLFGQLRGNIDKCVEEAIKDWVEKGDEKK